MGANRGNNVSNVAIVSIMSIILIEDRLSPMLAMSLSMCERSLLSPMMKLPLASPLMKSLRPTPKSAKSLLTWARPLSISAGRFAMLIRALPALTYSDSVLTANES